MDIIKNLLDPKYKIIISILLGFGLAAAFKKTCASGKTCFIVKGPKTTEVEGYVFKVDQKCYQYVPRIVD